jgi:hypothetical protein
MKRAVCGEVTSTSLHVTVRLAGGFLFRWSKLQYEHYRLAVTD